MLGEEKKKIRLNKYISNCGICSRRAADELIKKKLIKVNGKIVSELGFKIDPEDSVTYRENDIKPKNNIYFLLNKPKDFITTTSDPKQRKTVMDLMKRATKERIYPVGRLDRNTTGLLLLTNDGEIAKTLAHPSSNIKKIYHIKIDKPLLEKDLNKIKEGSNFEEGKVIIDQINILNADRTEIGLQIHIGWNRIVRRIFEYFKYKVIKLDRVGYDFLTKLNLPRGKYRKLTDLEINKLKKNCKIGTSKLP